MLLISFRLFNILNAQNEFVQFTFVDSSFRFFFWGLSYYWLIKFKKSCINLLFFTISITCKSSLMVLFKVGKLFPTLLYRKSSSNIKSHIWLFNRNFGELSFHCIPDGGVRNLHNKTNVSSHQTLEYLRGPLIAGPVAFRFRFDALK